MELMSQYDPTVQALKKIIKKLKAEKKKLRKASPASAPEGWKIVPVEPTGEMVDAGIRSLGTADKFRAMLAAAPTPPVSEDRKDAERFRFMLDDHAEKTTRQRVRELFERLPVMSLSAARAAIDAAMQEDKQ